MTPETFELRRKIAEDILFLLETEKFKPSRVYFQLSNPDILEQTDLLGEELQKLINNEKSVCEVCAIGAIFGALVLRHDGFKLEKRAYAQADGGLGIWERIRLVNFLKSYFTENELTIIEAYFEDWNSPTKEIKLRNICKVIKKPQLITSRTIFR
jgi:hypothetical protein